MHASLQLGGEGDVAVDDGDSRFGTFVNGVRAKSAVLHQGGVIRFGSSPTYTLQGMVLRPGESSPVSLSLRNIGIRRGGRQLLAGITAEVPPSALVAVLGPSGAGKSLLIASLSGTLALSEGNILVDGTTDLPECIERFRDRCGIVTQDDAVYREQTVEENLREAAIIRLPLANGAERAAAVQNAMSAVDLEDHAGKRSEVLSGGQRKRVSIAIELLRRPGLLLLDEPTSGLDPAMQARLMETLRQLALRGVTIICTTHTLETLHFFDKVLVLGLGNGVGTLAYDGMPSDLLPAFHVDNYADLFDRLLALDSVGAIAHVDARPHPPQTGMALVPAASSGVQAKRAPWGEGVQVTLRRTLRGMWRDPMMRLLAVAQPVILAALVVAAQSGEDAGVSPFFLFATVSCVWMGMTLTVRELVRERHLYTRDRLAGLGALGYLHGKFAAVVLVTLLQTIIFGLGIRVGGPQVMSNAIVANAISNTPVWALFPILWLMAMAGAMQGFIVSTLANSERTAVAAIPLVLLPQIVFSRAAAGQGMLPVNAPSPYSPLYHFGLSGLSGAMDKLTAIVSLPLPTRPGAMSLQLAGLADGYAAALEVCYLCTLVAVAAIVAQWAFERREGRWLTIR